jgi:glycosyltransferase involved in cell wall biosynthesis
VTAGLAVVIPTRDRCDLLDATLASLANQGDRHFETVVADHGSADDTAGTVQRWSRALRITYVRLTPEPRSPGWVRDAGVRSASSDILVFLDSGMVVPATFAEAHRGHHRSVSAVGLGMCHGYRLFGHQSGDWPRLLRAHANEQLKAIIEADDELRDERFGVLNLDRLSIPWVYGWSGNLSVTRELYLKAGGFDKERAQLYEDLDLAYRLHAHGGRFGIVDEGWAVHLPHPVHSIGRRMRSIEAGWRLSYSRYRSLPLEAAWLARPDPITWRRSAADYGASSDAMARHLERSVAGAAPVEVTSAGLGLRGPTLLVGGSRENAGHFDYVACGRRDVAAEETVWGCTGVLIPLPAESLECVVVTGMWRRLGARTGRLRLVDRLISEIARVAKEAIFLDSGQHNEGDLTPADLIAACQNQGLPWRIV